jgi:hypothetical protein
MKILGYVCTWSFDSFVLRDDMTTNLMELRRKAKIDRTGTECKFN